MDINELETYRLSDAIKFNNTLNPTLWDSSEHLHNDVRDKLLKIAEDFKEFLGISNIEIKDITISGSNAAYTYTDSSDIDLHLVVDLPRADVSEVYRELFDAKKYQYNDQHNFAIGGYPVELYVQNANEEHVSQGIYSVLTGKWIRVPSRKRPTVDDISVRSKYEDLGQRIESAVKSGDLEKMQGIAGKIKKLRQAGLAKTGEFGPENLAFKLLRNNGLLDQLRIARQKAKDQLLSLDERKKKKTKKSKKSWGRFGGLWFPGYNNIGQAQNDADTVTPADIGGESVQEQLDVKTLEPTAIAAKHNVSVKTILDQLRKGIKVELEHTSDADVAKEIALDHLAEFPDYYDRLERVETNESKTTGVKTLVSEFTKFCQHELGIEQVPQIKIKHDPAWSHRNGTFGQFNPDLNTIIVSAADRHPVDVLRTLAHELVHLQQEQTVGLPPGAGADGSDWENEANARAGEIMRAFARQNPKYFDRDTVTESSGYIPVNDQEAQDPRYSMAVTQDIKPGETQRQAKKMGFKTDPAGRPPQARTNGLVESLTRRLQTIKESQETVTEQDLEEVAMSPGALQKFMKSDAASGMMAGFEAELIFKGLAEPDDYGEMEPDYDEDRRAQSIDDIVDFFSEGPYSDLSRNEIERLRSVLLDEFLEWRYDRINRDWSDQRVDYINDYIDDNDLFDRDAAEEEATEYVGADADPSEIDDRVEEMRSDFLDKILNAGPGEASDIYSSAFDQFEEEMSDDYDDYEWFSDQDRYMSDIQNEFGLIWPYMIPAGNSEEGFNEESAQRLADELTTTLGVTTTVSGGYHSARRDAETWIFEPDSSLDGDDPDDMPVEIVSPPMPLEQAFEIIPKFFEWAASNGAYTNKSTGFHMSVSLPDHDSSKLDYTKLALFLGDEYVLKQFGRAANTYTESALKKIKQAMSASTVSFDNSEPLAVQALSKMREHLGQYASRILASSSGFGKYTSINPKDGYVEFRSAGGSSYMEDLKRLQNTLLRYSRALQIAMDPDAERAEYAKKFYKLLQPADLQQTMDPKTGRKRTQVKAQGEQDPVWLFAQYAAGELPRQALMSFVRQLQGARAQKKVDQTAMSDVGLPDFDRNGNYRIVHRPSGETAFQFNASGHGKALEVFSAWRSSRQPAGTEDSDFTVEPVNNRRSGSMPPHAEDGNFEIFSRDTNNPIWRFDAEDTNAAVEALYYWRDNIRHPSSNPENFGVRVVGGRSPFGEPFQTTQNNPNMQQYVIDYTLDGLRSSYQVTARSTSEARNILVAKLRDAGADMNTLTTHSVEPVAGNTNTSNRNLPFVIIYRLHDSPRTARYSINAPDQAQARAAFIRKVTELGRRPDEVEIVNVEQLR